MAETLSEDEALFSQSSEEVGILLNKTPASHAVGIGSGGVAKIFAVALESLESGIASVVVELLVLLSEGVLESRPALLGHDLLHVLLHEALGLASSGEQFAESADALSTRLRLPSNGITNITDRLELGLAVSSELVVVTSDSLHFIPASLRWQLLHGLLHEALSRAFIGELFAVPADALSAFLRSPTDGFADIRDRLELAPAVLGDLFIIATGFCHLTPAGLRWHLLHGLLHEATGLASFGELLAESANALSACLRLPTNRIANITDRLELGLAVSSELVVVASDSLHFIPAGFRWQLLHDDALSRALVREHTTIPLHASHAGLIIPLDRIAGIRDTLEFASAARAELAVVASGSPHRIPAALGWELLHVLDRVHHLA